MVRRNYTYVTGNVTDPGKVRDENQDYFGAYRNTPYGDVWVVCDGMGGAVGGRTASELAVEATRKALMQPGWKDEIAALMAAVELANKKINDRAAADSRLHGMGTTIVLLLINDGVAYLGHVGDSRAYLLREGVLCQMTKDHTMVQELFDGGQLSPEEMSKHPDSHVITRSVGIGAQVEVDIDGSGIELRAGDCFILCTDGLSGLIDDDAIADIARERSPSAASRALARMANDAGGYDNVTVQIVAVRQGPSTQRQAIAALLRALSGSSGRKWLVSVVVAAVLVTLVLLLSLSAGLEDDLPVQKPPSQEEPMTDAE